MKLVTMLLLLGFLSVSYALADVADTPEQVEFFESKIRPVLVQRCYACHNSLDEHQGGLVLDHKAALLAGGDSGPAIVPQNLDESLLIRAIRHDGEHKMPLDSPKLSDAIIRDFETWVNMGAADPRLKKPTEADREAETDWLQLRSQRANWWSFQPLQLHDVPRVTDSQWDTTAIDRFVFARMDAEQLTPQPIADPAVLVRRVHLILTGLPPKPNVVAAFLDDPSPAAYEQLVDQLLASKQFGERWARHWMDWYRYAESHGSEGDPQIPFAAEYRDYLIRALNADVPYDQLLREHLAGDLLNQPRTNVELDINESAIGPAHLRMVPHGFGVTDAYDEQITFTDNQIDVITKAMLGLTVSCARCHNHKFDPVSQKDFYRLYGIMVSCRPSTVVVDSPERLNTNRTAIAELKSRLRGELAEFWLRETNELPVRLAATTIFQQVREGRLKAERPANFEELKGPAQKKAERAINAEQKRLDRIAQVRELTHPLGAWYLLTDVESDEYAARIEEQLAELQTIRDGNTRAKASAEFYLDLRDEAALGKWHASGNGTAGKVSPAGSFTLQVDGEHAVAGIYPRGVYSHLISDKHAAVLVSGNFIARGAKIMTRVIGSGAQLRVPVRNYPLTHGGLHPATGIDHARFRWRVATNKWQYWQGESVHYEMRTSKEWIPNPGPRDRSWYGITEVIAGDDLNLREEGASLLSLVDDPEKIADRPSLESAYVEALQRALRHWRDGQMSDREAEFLDAFVQFGFLTNRVDQLPATLQAQVTKFRELEQAIPVPKRAPGVIESEPVDQPLLVRGNYKQESAAVARQFLEVFSRQPYESGSGRLELAEDMVSEANTLKSRVLVNRLWAYVFGRGIVSSTDNFGLLGERPTHAELLDHLALDFEANGWSIKQALRQMVTSRAFKSASRATTETLTRDAENRYLSHFTSRRLDAEAIHDSINQLADQSPRAVYSPVVRNRLDPFLGAFNAPIPVATVSFRTNTNVPAQSLATMNSKMIEEAASSWIDRINSNKGPNTTAERIEALFQEAYARSPTDEELDICGEYLGKTPDHNAYVRLAHALLNTKEFIYVY